MRVVLDTNVLVSAMLAGGNAPDLALQLVLQGDAMILVDSRILAEYDEVTARLRFGFDNRERLLLLDAIERIAEPVLARPLRLSLPNPEDRMFVEVAVAGKADAIATGNRKHFIPKKGTFAVDVMSPREFVDRLRR